MDLKGKKPIVLTTSGYWDELEKLFMEGKMTREAANTLKALINSERSHTIPPTVTLHLIQQIKACASDGILLKDSALELLYQVIVYVPDSENKEGRQFVSLMRMYPGENMRRLDELCLEEKV